MFTAVGICLLLFIAFVIILRTHGHPERTFVQPVEQTRVGQGSIVVTYHPEARQIGESILDSGGNAFDALVAVVIAENVLAEGVSSLAGPLGVLTYHARSGEVHYLDAEFNDPLDPDAHWDASDPKPGMSLLVPGAPAGLEALARTYGTLAFSKLIEPSIKLAHEGFAVNHLMAAFIVARSKVLKSTEFGRRTYFRNGKPLQAGQVLRLPETAEFLTKLSEQGSAYVYSGAWGDQFLQFASSTGGSLTREDLGAYEVIWRQPWTADYRGYQIHSSSGHSYGGAWVLLALKTLEHESISAADHYSNQAPGLEKMVRVARQVWSEPWLFDHLALDEFDFVQSCFTLEYTGPIWEAVLNRAPANFMGQRGQHSYQIVVVDRDGNIANGTTTIESDPWADGYFVQGVALPSTGKIPWNTAPGERRLSPFSMEFAFLSGQPRFVVGTISNSAVETSFQLLVNLIDYDLPVREAVSMPRFGTFPCGKKPPINPDRNWLDPRVRSRVVRQVARRGISFIKKGFIDTGLGVAVAINTDRSIHGITVPVPYIKNPFTP